METFLIYQLKVAILAAVMYLLYKWVLGKQTFHGFNRAMLLLICALSFILPACRMGETRLVSQVRKVLPEMVMADAKADAATSVHRTASQEQQTDGYQTADTPNDESLQTQATDIELAINAQNADGTTLNWKKITGIGLFVIWCAGFLFLLARKLLSLISIRRVIREGRYQDRQDECDLIESDVISQPMNWMNFIMMPHDWILKENQAVWKHELSHARKAHSLDLLILDLMQLFQWFNPAMMLLYKQMELLHEFQADRAVLESGADARQYKLMLVDAVAQNRGYAMTSWLRQTNLKQRIDMMQRKESNRWNRLRALFIPVVALVFMVVNQSLASAQDSTFHWAPFQDGKTWVYENGMAKVLTADGVQSNMKATGVADYLAGYKPVKTTRMTLRYMYNVDDLNTAYPLARSLADKGIFVNVANNDDMLTEMTMPEYRTPAIYDLGGGQFRFEMNCNLKSIVHGKILFGRPIDIYGRGVSEVVNPSVTGTLDQVMQWIDLFDGHGLAIYPLDMTAKQADKIAKAVWKHGLDQVSIVSDSIIKGTALSGRIPCDYRITTIVPKNYSFEKEFGDISVMEAVKKMHANRTSAYYGKGQRVEKPKFFAGDAWHEITDVINGPDELILITRIDQGSYQWVIGFSNCEIEAGGVRYKMTRSEGMEGFEQTYFWSPTFGYFYQTLHFPPIPEDVQTINFYENNPTNTITKLQVVPGIDIFEGVRVVKYPEDAIRYILHTTHVGDEPGVLDVATVKRVDFTNKETTVYCGAFIRNAHSYPGHISSDFKLTLGPGGRVLEPIRYEGVPVDQDFDRHGDWVDTPFQIVFPAISQEEWEAAKYPVLTGSILHEPVTLTIKPLEIREAGQYGTKPMTTLEPGNYTLRMSVNDGGKTTELNPRDCIGLSEKVTVDIVDGEIVIKDLDGKSKNQCVISFTNKTFDAAELSPDVTVPESSEVLFTVRKGMGRKTLNGSAVSVYDGDVLAQAVIIIKTDDTKVRAVLLIPAVTVPE